LPIFFSYKKHRPYIIENNLSKTIEVKFISSYPQRPPATGAQELITWKPSFSKRKSQK
jgi:hypothetical protein